MLKKICIVNHSFNTGKIVPNSVHYDAVEFEILENDMAVRITRSYFDKKCRAKTLSKRFNISEIFTDSQNIKIKLFLSDIENIEKHYKTEYFDKNSIARYSQTEITVDNKVYVFANDNCSDELYLLGVSGIIKKHFPLFDLRGIKTEIVKQFLK